ncbi:MAG: protein kinase [Planctomycetes bacterium]|nr:protein kinase [Planctomycetota bacterium]
MGDKKNGGNGSSPSAGTGSGDLSRGEALLAEYVERLNAGEAIDIAAIKKDHPEIAADLIHQLRLFQGVFQDPASPASLGTLGDYTLRRQIGRGGMGVVYEAWQNSMDRQVALKVMPKAIAVDTKAVARFIQEAQLAGRLNHPNIVHVHGMGVEQQVPYYAMDFVEGETLAQIVGKLKDAEADTETPFGEKDDVRYYANLAEAFAAVADGLQHAHSKGITHRDIKPSNLILDREECLRILDFGLARIEGQESLTISGDVVGTPQYMSPEQARRKNIPIDHRTDVYSLGATLYEMLTLQPPFRGKDHNDTLSQIIERDPAEPRKLNPRVPKDLETIVLKCLRKEPADRYGTAEALGQDLRRFVRGDPIEARPEAAADRLGRWLQRRRKSIVVAGAVLAVGIAGLTAAVALITRAYSITANERDARSRDLYVSDMRLALSDWEDGNFSRFESLVERHQPQAGEQDLRGWEWHYLESLRHGALKTVEVDPRGAVAVAWNPKGTEIATGNGSGAISVLQAADGKTVHHLQVDDSPVRAVAWCPDGGTVVGVSQAGTVRGWRVPNVTEAFNEDSRLRFERGREPRAASWSPDGAWLATAAGDGCIKLRDGHDGRVLKQLPAEDANCVSCLDWRADSQQLAACYCWPGSIVIYDSHEWREAKRVPLQHGWLFFVVWSAEGKRIVIGAEQGHVYLYDLETGVTDHAYVKHAGHIFAGKWSPDGTRIATAGQDSLIKLWHPDQPDETPAILRGHRGAVWSIAWSPDGDRLASASTDGTVKVWSAAPSRNGQDLPGEHAAAWSPEGKWIAVSSRAQEAILVLDAVTRDSLATLHGGPVSAVSFSADGKSLVSAGPGALIRIFAWQEGQEVARVEGSQFGEVTCVAWSPRGDWIASGGDDRRPRVWDARSLNIVTELPTHADRFGAVAWSPDGTRLATTSIDLGLRIYETGSWRMLLDLRRGQGLGQSNYWTGPHAIAWSPDGTKLAATVAHEPNALVIFDARTGQEAFKDAGHVSGLASVAWSPDGKRLATGGFDFRVKVWDAERFEELIQLRGHTRVVATLAWHPDGKKLLTGTGSEIKVWDASQEFETR